MKWPERVIEFAVAETQIRSDVFTGGRLMPVLEIAYELNAGRVDEREALAIGQFSSLLELYEAIADAEDQRDFAAWPTVVFNERSFALH